MNYCDQCGARLVLNGTQCASCEVDLTEALATFPATDSVTETVSKFLTASPYRLQAIGLVCLPVVWFLALSYLSSKTNLYTGWFFFGWVLHWLVLFPLGVGALLVAIYGPQTPTWLIRINEWMGRRAEATEVADGRFNSFVTRPAFWAYGFVSGKADTVQDPALRVGAKAASYAFTITLFLFLLYVIAAVVIGVVMFVALIFLTLKIIEMYEGTDSRASSSVMSSAKRAMSVVGKKESATYHSGTNFLSEQVAGRIDDQGHVYEGSNFFTEQRVGRVDDEGNFYEGTNFLNEQKIGRIDPDGNVFQGTNFLNEEKVGRIDKDGNVVEGSNWLTERKIGRIERKT